MKSNKIFIKIVFILLIFLLIYSSSKIISHELDLKENKKVNIKIKKYVKEDKIDFENLKKQNTDTKGHIKVNNTNIDYIVVQTDNNEYYLTHNFQKQKNVAGWIFVDYRNKVDGTDKNLIIYGHNMKDGSMFDSLKNVLNKEWYTEEENKIITFTTENNTYKYEVFSTYSIEREDYYITTNFNNNDEYLKFINKLKERSIHDYKVELNKEDKIITLSSCIDIGKKRVVLHARLINE